MPIAITDIPIDRVLSPEELINTISKLFQVEPEKFVVSDRKEDYTKIKDHNTVLCAIVPCGGEFPCEIEVLPARAIAPTLEQRIEVVGKLCDLLNCRALVKTGDQNPFIYFEILGSNHHRKVMVRNEVLKGNFSVFKAL